MYNTSVQVGKRKVNRICPRWALRARMLLQRLKVECVLLFYIHSFALISRISTSLLHKVLFTTSSHAIAMRFSDFFSFPEILRMEQLLLYCEQQVLFYCAALLVAKDLAYRGVKEDVFHSESLKSISFHRVLKVS